LAFIFSQQRGFRILVTVPRREMKEKWNRLLSVEEIHRRGVELWIRGVLDMQLVLKEA
jgi:hypothetical protein